MPHLIVEKSTLSGTIPAPPSKSYTHRATIASMLSPGESVILNPLICDDTEATKEACIAFGAKVTERRNEWVVEGTSRLRTPEELIDCRESASTMRFLIPVAALVPGIVVFSGRKSLRRRPMGALLDSLDQLRVKCYAAKGEEFPPIIVFGEGKIRGGRVKIPGHISSQFISGLLFACPYAQRDTEISLTTPLASVPYVMMTVGILSKHGIKVDVSDDLRIFRIPSGQVYDPYDHRIEGDYSSSSFLLVAAAITGSCVTVTNLNPSSLQADIAIVQTMKKMGAKVEVGPDYVRVKGGELKGIEVDVRHTPDLAPVYAVLACYAKGRTRIFGARRLRMKESDRLLALSTTLGKMGAKIREFEDGLVIDGPCRLHGASIDPYGDHRIAMACAVAGLGAEGMTRIKNPECINKSYPDFVRDLRSLGAKVKVE